MDRFLGEQLSSWEDLVHEDISEIVHTLLPGADAQALRRMSRVLRTELYADAPLAEAPDSQTQLLLACSRIAEQNFARIYSSRQSCIEAAQAELDRANRQHDFSLLDADFADFMISNKRGGEGPWSLEELLKIRCSHPGREFVYKNKGTKYYSNVWCRDSWVRMQWEEIQLGMPQIIQQVVPLYQACIPWYNKFMAKIDLEFIEPKDATVPELLIGFEHGAPAYDKQLEAHWF
ncbi:TPA: hypothetical protein ACH3X1_009908 [Trebouxia sp. C0004]